ncbi:CAP domain-containing protein [Mucilaginibacter sp. UR6-11]|uniref:CAP domain-containing protein n=1 Tax=Mucilaginibacter sp. UR6-11 TaxID=1435644 RepID=UPI001E3ECA38|nr:CAP domain-containing protein [Mucilaginibacter sp. UR6-11]MCC8426244.1 CAP domain-containing protein [Mucilaginibacter sp. UR6-11]
MRNVILSITIVLTFVTSVVFGQSPGSNKFKKEFLRVINRTRANGCICGTNYMPPAPPLMWNDKLEKAAKGHAQDMASRRYFSHVSKDGRDAMARAENAGYDHFGFKSFTVGENIAQGQPTIAEVMTGWINSEGHCRNLMNPDFKEVGIWVTDTYWVQDFGGREEFSAEMKQMIKSGKARIIQGSVHESH